MTKRWLAFCLVLFLWVVVGLPLCTIDCDTVLSSCSISFCFSYLRSSKTKRTPCAECVSKDSEGYKFLSLIPVLRLNKALTRVCTVRESQGELSFLLWSGKVRECQGNSRKLAMVKGKIVLSYCRSRKIYAFELKATEIFVKRLVYTL